MATGGVAAAPTGLAILLTNPGSINFGHKPLFPLKTPNFHSQYCSRTITTEITRNSRWDSNAETGRSQKFKFKFRDKNKRYRDDDIVDGEEEEEEEEESSGMGIGKKRRWWSDKPPYMEEEKAPGILEEFLDSLWILKLSKFYGWTLPPMIISSLIATGPKAFLMTLSLTIGLSVLSFVFQKLMGKRSKPRLRARKRRWRPFVSYPGNVGTYNREEEGRQGETVKGNGMPRSWVVNNDSSVKKDKQDAPSFGGWDELDGMEYIERRSPPTPREAAQKRRKPSTDRKLGRRGESDAPLLLRLLIAVFPFLASWTKML